MCRKMVDNGLLSFICSVDGDSHEGPCATPEVERSMVKRRRWEEAQGVLRQSQGRAVTAAEGLHADPSAALPHPALKTPTTTYADPEFEVIFAGEAEVAVGPFVTLEEVIGPTAFARAPRSVVEGEQPMPMPREGGSVQELVILDIQERMKVGMERYGTLLQPFNGRKALRDLYEELLDACQYLRQYLEEERLSEESLDPETI